MIERGFDWLARLLFVLVALALFTLAISLVISGSWSSCAAPSAARSASTT